jgi:hypothetical protein
MKIDFDAQDKSEVNAVYNMILELQMQHNSHLVQKVLVPKTDHYYNNKQDTHYPELKV